MSGSLATRAAALAVATLMGFAASGCSVGEPDPKVALRRQASAFLEATRDADLATLCELFTPSFLERLAPPSGDCAQAMSTLTLFTGAGAADTLGPKRVKSVEVDGKTATVLLADKISGENELPMRMVLRGDGWLIDDMGAGAQISQACIDEREAVEQAVDEFLSDNDTYPADLEALVPGYLRKAPANHTVSADGTVTATAICA